MFALGGFVHVLVVHPAPAVARDLVAELDECRGQFGVALQRHADAKDRQRQLPLFEFAQDAPNARARPVLINAFHAEVAVGVAGGVEHFGQELFRPRVTVQDAVLAAFFVIQHELHGDAGAAGPLRVRRIPAVADKVAGVGKGGIVGVHERGGQEAGFDKRTPRGGQVMFG
ncbi:hypothetical protein D3C71_1699830 [compost metagenome]